MSVVRLTTSVADIDAVSALYDAIQYFRSTTGLNGTYTEITAPSPTAAQLLGTINGPFNLNGLTLSITLSGADPLDVAFSGTDPIGISAVLSAINAVMPVPIATAQAGANSNKLALTNPTTGTGSTMQVAGSAASVLGLVTTKVSGKSARPLIADSILVYRFADFDGDVTYWYKNRFSSSKTGALSAFSDAEQGAPSASVAGGDLVTASANLIDAAGNAIAGRRVIFVPVAPKTVTDGSTPFVLLPSSARIEAVTDAAGNMKIALLKGATMRVYFEGTPFSREFVVPSADFNLMSVIGTQPDPFDIVQSPPMPIRLS